MRIKYIADKAVSARQVRDKKPKPTPEVIKPVQIVKISKE